LLRIVNEILMTFLSKSRIQSGQQCHRRLWLELNQRERMNWSPQAQSRLDAGTQFGELAQSLLGGGLLIRPGHRELKQALAETAAALTRPSAEVPRLFEPAFEHEGVRVRVDALERSPDGDRLVEVKSTTGVKESYLWDCAIQTWVARGAGRPIRSVGVGHINNRFVYTTEGDYGGLLTVTDITSEVEALVPLVPGVVAELKQVIAGSEPAIRTGAHCSSPYDCPFMGHCSSQEPPRPTYPVAILPRIGRLLERLTALGFDDLTQVPDELLDSELHKRVALASRTGMPWTSGQLPALLAALPYPRHYLDFETVGFVIPRWLGTRPFQALPFQFSCHTESADGQLDHRGFLDLSGAAPMAGFVEAVLAAVGDRGPILVWNRGFEAGVLRRLAPSFPQHAAAIEAAVDRMVDLLPIYREHYYHPGQMGSWSIKAVLPTVVPDLDYTALSVADGQAAQLAYQEAIEAKTTPERRAEIRDQLERYCELDTLAMVRLVQHWTR
jgi:hypothetical protein